VIFSAVVLGITESDFSALRPLFSTMKSRVLLVEGPLDQEYFEYLQGADLPCEKLNEGIQVAPYGGKSTLKNVLLLQFVLKTFDIVFVTYDLDADQEASRSLKRLNLLKHKDFAPLGIPEPGRDRFEGLLPRSVTDAVNGRESDTVMKLGSSNSQERRQARDVLKKAYLREFKQRADHKEGELAALSRVVKMINKRLAAN